jgi:hypothetical protein
MAGKLCEYAMQKALAVATMMPPVDENACV